METSEELRRLLADLLDRRAKLREAGRRVTECSKEKTKDGTAATCHGCPDKTRCQWRLLERLAKRRFTEQAEKVAGQLEKEGAENGR